jgi:hypothetical protein
MDRKDDTPKFKILLIGPSGNLSFIKELARLPY